MKKNFIYALMSVIALTGAVSLTSCSSSDNLEDVNPTYDGKTVKTQINIGLTSKVGNPTRMAYETVQAAQTYASFRGMEKIKLISFDKSISAGTETRLGSIIDDLADISGTDLTASAATKTAVNTDGGANYLVYEDVSVPQGTTNFLFYGKAPSDDFAKGKLTVSNLDDAANSGTTGYTGEFTDPGHVKFTPTSIVDPENDDDEAANNDAGKKLLGLLNNVASASAKIGTKTVADAAGEEYKDISGTPHTTTAANEVYIDYTSATETNWKAVTADQNNTLFKLFQSFKTLTSNSSFNVQRTLQDLYNTLNDIITVKATGFEVAEAIQTAIKGYGDESTTNTYNPSTEELSLGTAYRNYPSALFLPDGAARIDWDNEHGFYDVLKHNKDNSGSVADNASTATLFSSYAYPADLWYTANTALKASTVKQSGNFGTTNNWATILSTNYSSSTDVVSGATRSVALVNEINYAVGRLDISINPLEGKTVGETTLTDYYDSKGNKFDFSATGAFKDGFTLTGVLIGNQKQVGWDFTTTSNGADLEQKEYVIYDKTMNNSTSHNPIVALTPSTGSGTNYTLVLETTKDADVNIALEFKNNGADFFGKGGQLIPAGGTFYLTGKLTPAYGGEKYGEVGGKVFKQDYYTTAIITIDLGDSTVPDGQELVGTPKGFQLATNTIPDLRTPQLELCFSVNLQWNQGLTFTETW